MDVQYEEVIQVVRDVSIYIDKMRDVYVFVEAGGLMQAIVRQSKAGGVLEKMVVEFT